MTTFVLVHGAWHGAWCWEKFIPHLRAKGHEVVTMDLPCEDGTATFDTYADVVVAATERVEGEDIVLVGHSLGAMTIPIVATRRPVRGLVALCGVLPAIGRSPWSGGPEMEAAGTFTALQKHPDGSTTWPDVESASRAFYGEASSEDAAWAFERLRPQNSSGLFAGRYPLTELPEAPWTSIACRDDPVVRLEWARWATEVRLGSEPIEMDGDHSPFLSRPEELAGVLVSVVAVG